MKASKKQEPAEISDFISQFDPISQTTLWELRDLIAKYICKQNTVLCRKS